MPIQLITSLVIAVLKHLPNVETRFYCPQALLSVDFQCRDDASEWKIDDLGLKRASDPLAVREILLLTCRGLLLHEGVCQGGLAGSEEVSEANGFHLDCTVAGVPHAADQL